MISIFRSIVHSPIRRSIQTMTDGTISATGDGRISLSADTDYRVTIGAGNTIDLSLVDLT